MSTPRRRSGFRLITVNELSFRWKFMPGESSSLFVAYGASSSSARLEVMLPQWRDPWLNINGFSVTGAELRLTTSAHNQPPVITNRFARAAILAGIDRGFLDVAAGGTLSLEYRGHEFNLTSV